MKGDHSGHFNGSAMWFDCIMEYISELSQWFSFLPGLSRLSVPCATKTFSRKWKQPLGSPWTCTTWTTRCSALCALCMAPPSPITNSAPRNLIFGSSFNRNRYQIPDPKANVLILIKPLTDLCVVQTSASCSLVLLLLRTLSFYLKPSFHLIISSGSISILFSSESQGLASLCSLQTANPGSN